MEIENFNVTALSLSEIKEINGGGPAWSSKLAKWFKTSLWALGAGIIIDNWAEIKSGLMDGYNDALND
jgi:hypothetical protein